MKTFSKVFLSVVLCIAFGCLWPLTLCLASSLTPPPEPGVPPIIEIPASIDKNMDRIDDSLEARISQLQASAASTMSTSQRTSIQAALDQPTRVELLFSRQITQEQIDDFLGQGGEIRYVYRNLSYGWNAVIPLRLAESLPSLMGDSFVGVVQDTFVDLCLDDATRTGRIRPVWQAGFAGNSSGFSGSATTTIGIIDSGVDASHTDLAGRMEYWQDYTTEAYATARDYEGHGSHVAGIALGSGNAAGMGNQLLYTDSGNMTTVAAGSYIPSPIHIPTAASATLTSTATWNEATTTNLYGLFQPNGSSGFSTLSSAAIGSSPLTETNTFASSSGNHYTVALTQATPATITRYAIANTVTYAPVGDGFNTFRGVAPGCKWAGAKVFTDGNSALSSDIGQALDDLVAQRITHNIKVVNMSLGSQSTTDPTMRTKVNNMVNNGIVVVASAGNGGPSTPVHDPGRAANAITVAASNDINQLTSYTSVGFSSPTSSEDSKPDVMAPGGSQYFSGILSADSNNSDAERLSFPDVRANDYANYQGTSMAAPFVAGAVALVIQALESTGVTWSFSSSGHPFLVKMLLCATSTESNAPREANTGTNPTLDRATAPKDLNEGYGMVNPDAAIEAVTQTYVSGNMSNSTNGGYVDRRAWARKLTATNGVPIKFSLDVPSSGDFDLYVYSGTPGSKGNPVIRDSGTIAGVGADESIDYTPAANETAYLVIKRISGSGTWNLAGSTIADATAPATPVVTDDGAFTTSGTQLHASWISTDSISGIAEYQYAVSNTKTEAGIVSGGGWVSAGSQTQQTRTGLALAYGQIYYILVKAKNGVGLWSAVGVSDGIVRVQNTPASIGAAKAFGDSVTVGLSAKTVTALFGTYFYAQEPLGSTGIRVEPIDMPAGLALGQTVDIGGTMQTTANERAVRLAAVALGSPGTTKILSLANRAVAGPPWQYNTISHTGQNGVTGAVGVNNVGLLVRAWGRITQVGSGYIYVSDGSVTDSQQSIAVRVNCNSAGYLVGHYVSVTGISSLFDNAGSLQRLIQTRSASDVVRLQ